MKLSLVSPSIPCAVLFSYSFQMYDCGAVGNFVNRNMGLYIVTLFNALPFDHLEFYLPVQ